LTVTVFDHGIEASVATAPLTSLLNIDGSVANTDRLSFDLAPLIRRRGQELRMVFPPQQRGLAAPDPKLIAMVVDAHHARDTLVSQGADQDVAERRRAVRYAWLAPDIIAAIIEGRQPPSLTARSLRRMGAVPLCWSQQRAMLGFG
jgi:site-specific DNA recombinase